MTLPSERPNPNDLRNSAQSPSKGRQAAERVAGALHAHGFQAYLVGGCVRDLLRGVEPKDYDVATDARPEQVLELFPGALAVGAQFGVVGVLEEGERIEVATFRSDGLYSDGRRPDDVSYSTDPREDVLRRDFTINGLLLDPSTGEVFDFVDGRKDLERRVIRAIGNPNRRFEEDHLRMLRAVRFAASLDSKIEPQTFAAIRRLSGKITTVSAERVRDELLRILTCGRAQRGFELLDESGLLPEILPEIAKMKGVEQPPEYHPEGDVWTHTLLMIEALPAGCSPTLAMGVLLHDVGKPPTFRVAPDRIRFDNHVSVGMVMAREISNRLRLSHDETTQIVALVEHHLRFRDAPLMRASTLKRFLRLEKFEEHLELHRLDCLSSHRNLENYEFVRAKLAELPAAAIRPAPLLNGRDLIEMGYRPGPQFKEIIRAVEDAQLDGQLISREAAIQFVLERFKSIYIVGVKHSLQAAGPVPMYPWPHLIEEKVIFRDMLESLIQQHHIQFVGEEWGRFENGTYIESIAVRLSKETGCRYGEIDTFAMRDALGVPRDYPPKDEGHWNQVREQGMFEQTVSQSAALQNILVICGYDHSRNLEKLFHLAGHAAKVVLDVRDEIWCKDDPPL